MSRAIQICGTGSGVGKSVIVAGLCRIFLQDGKRVAPFKAQNMALNSFVTHEGGEIGRAQAYQAQAARVGPSIYMNPVLIKPTSETGAQVIVQGKAVGNMSALKYTDYKGHLRKVVTESFERLKDEYEIVVIEGAGSPAEINLKSHDIVNMNMAKIAKAPVILVGDIDMGGVFAWLVGTLELLDRKERQMIKGFIINKFRGDKRLLESGLKFLERKTSRPVLGVIPYFYPGNASEVDRNVINLPEEDAVPKHKIGFKRKLGKRVIKIDILYLPHISNFTDFDALESEGGVGLRYVDRITELDPPDAIIIPGTKNTVHDYLHLKRSGILEKISEFRKKGGFIAGICGGFQMLGREIKDSHKIESGFGKVEGLGLLNVATSFRLEKTLSQVKAKDLKSGIKITGYEIHHGKTRYIDAIPMFEIVERQGKPALFLDGARTEDGRVWGTYIHGVFDSKTFRRDFINRIRIKKGWGVLSADGDDFDQDKEFDKLADLIRKNIDMKLLYRILERR